MGICESKSCADHIDAHDAARKGDLDAIAYVAEFAPEMFDVGDMTNRTPLHYAAWNGDAGVVAYMLAANADPNASTDHRETPLHIAAERSKPSAVSALLEAKADPMAKNEARKTALQYALKSRASTDAKKVITLLQEAEDDLNKM